MNKIILLFLFVSSNLLAQNVLLNKLEAQVDFSLNELSRLSKTAGNKVSPRTVRNDSLILVAPKDWCSGFFAGNLWYLYELTGKKKWAAQAENFTNPLEKEKMNAGTHDMGFKMFTSFGNGYRIDQNPAYKEILIQSARTNIKRFNPNTGVIRSWDHSRDKWVNPTIIDNMMNLELLFWAFKETRDSAFYKVAVSHANTTMKNHFRPDFSSYHVIDYDPNTGQVLKKNTHQGFAHESSWARGQAWALYGYTVCYRETGKKEYLQLAENIAQFLLKHPRMPQDLVPFWDFDDPKIPNVPRDASAAAIMASAFYDLATLQPDKKAYYQGYADQILSSLSSPAYLAPVGSAHGMLLLHSTGGLPNGFEVDAPIIYADYYFLEALVRQKNKK
ncbi:glucuronyl hydrolase [Cytophagaceae bacterium 50C-KIRBA]|uniref:Glucuronyl hydrolase n=1 Tax=Aquirufa beregesia TaxID=2516556 RepID=A0ABX0EWY5_9BACT|nr:glycoside hydrolase family 88 protein [Aquirufa beregesia]NGZ44959.1 glucuronyl hydrolase [Aquirufa beregesia]